MASPWDEISGSLRGPQVCRLAGISYRKLDYWDRIGLVRPSVAVANGSGSSRRYSPRDVLQLAVIEELTQVGLSLQSVRRHFSDLQHCLPDDPNAWSGLIVVWTTHCMTVVPIDQLADVVAGVASGPVALITLAPLAERIAADIRDDAPVPS